MRFIAAGCVHMIDHGKMRLGPPNVQALCVEPREGLRAGVFIHDVEIDIDQHVAIWQIAHLMGVDQFVIKCPAHAVAFA